MTREREKEGGEREREEIGKQQENRLHMELSSAQHTEQTILVCPCKMNDESKHKDMTREREKEGGEREREEIGKQQENRLHMELSSAQHTEQTILVCPCKMND